ncbi:hypothetical protein CONPUDRAFT_39734, partial [Coniophora puteana RWD-64-598 SS2]
GSANDATLWHTACALNLHVPAGKYFLADVGFCICSVLMVPYHATCYHLQEW